MTQVSIKMTFEERRYIFVALRYCSSRAPRLTPDPNFSDIQERCTVLLQAEILDKIEPFNLMKPGEVTKLKYTRSKWAAIYSALDFIWVARENKTDGEIMFLRSLIARIYPVISKDQIYL